MECREIVRDGQLHQAPRFGVFGVAGLAAGVVHPLIERCRMLLDVHAGDAQVMCGEE